MSGSGDLQPNSGLRYHTDADSPLPETINPIIDAVETISTNVSLLRHQTYDVTNKETIKIDHLGQDSVYLVVARGSAASRRGVWILSGYSIGGTGRNNVITLGSGIALSMATTAERYFELTYTEPSGYLILAITALIGGLPRVS